MCTGSLKRMHGRNGDPDRDDNKRDRVEEGGEHSGSLVAKGLFIGGRARLKIHSDEGEHQCQGIGDIVASLGDERQ